MNTRKAYRMLIVALFFIFISLISRSIIYLVLSVAIATMIIFLLSSNKKLKSDGNEKKQTEIIEVQNRRLSSFLWVAVVIGALLLGYGSLYFTENTIFHQYVPLPEQVMTAISLTTIGAGVTLTSLFFIIRESLVVKQNVIICQQCKAGNNGNHLYCHSCGQKIR
ncbi:hypothetical protein BKP35_01820 [Anaerobacillus arseniciselenatis]|uniref:Uncharacterized protein n=1 Tax=Anaerobacillus arseniciselenatis TaxID=85682 RepID=A0A1S2LUC0_9BACI|nr:hypothetical protein [Anaerobacillus arseniciselenatis]OIJ15753.1 hypothetical protein BKP35_01820 [Anaerobacillus arseniciselenatis]